MQPKSSLAELLEELLLDKGAIEKLSELRGEKLITALVAKLAELTNDVDSIKVVERVLIECHYNEAAVNEK